MRQTLRGPLFRCIWLLGIIALAAAHDAELRDTFVGISAVEATAIDVSALDVSALNPAIIGADGPELTQVDAAQRLGLSGKNITICVIDTGVDITHPTFGRGCPKGPHCRIAFGYDVESQGDDPSPTDWANAGGHGTHVSGIALGGFPHKLKDAEGNLLPYQRGVAYRAKLGAIRASTETSEFPYDYTRQALEKTIAKKCDVDNMSLGGFYVTPSKQLAPTIAKVIAADIVVTAAQGNDDAAVQTGARIFNVASPGAFEEVFSIGHVNNTANPGSVLLLDKAISTASGKRNKLVANQRADTGPSLCKPDCDSLNLPREITFIRMVARDAEAGEDPKSAACDMETVTQTKHAHSKGQVILLHIPKVCKPYQNSQEIWDLLQTLSPVLVLISLPAEEDSHVGAMYYRNQQTPVLWLREEDGHGLVAAMTAAPTTPIKLVDVPGAELVAVKEEYAGQPAITSALGPGYDLTMKPDISAPGALYSSLPNTTYQTWPGTSMAAPYMAGVIALWKEAMKKQGVKKPKGGWIQAAHIALKNTARPVPFKGSDKLMWSPVKVGAGVVQAYNAIVNKVRITPTQLLVRTDEPTQRFTLSLSNEGDEDVTYKLSHKPGVTVNLPKTWYGDGFDDQLPVANVAVNKKQVTVPAKGKVKVQLRITIPKELQATEGIYGGYIMLTPTSKAAGALTTMSTGRRKGLGSSVFPASTSSKAPAPLTVPYQGSTKDYSTVGKNNSLILFVPAMYELDATSSAALESKPPLFLCDVTGPGKCGYNPKTIRAKPGEYKGYRFASTLLRPVADVKVQVWSGNGKKHLGTSASQGPGGTAPPLRRTFLTAGMWDGKYIPKQSNADKSAEGFGQLKAGKTYQLRLELHPVLAAADRLAGRELKQVPLVVVLDTKLHVLGDDTSGTDDADIVVNPPPVRAITKPRKPTSDTTESDQAPSDKSPSDKSPSDKSTADKSTANKSASNKSKSGSLASRQSTGSSKGTASKRSSGTSSKGSTSKSGSNKSTASSSSTASRSTGSASTSMDNKAQDSASGSTSSKSKARRSSSHSRISAHVAAASNDMQHDADVLVDEAKHYVTLPL